MADFVIKKPLLAGTLDDLEKLKFPCLATPKLDGIRALRLGGDLLSRTFKRIKNPTVQRILAALLPEGSDGEIMVDGSFQDVQRIVMSSSETDKKFMYFWFDYVKDDAGKPYASRMDDMRSHIVAHPEVLQHPQAKIIPLYPVSLLDIPSVTLFEDAALVEGREGVIIRDPQGRYKMGRSSVPEGILLKLKKFSDDEATVTGCQELQHNQNEKVPDGTGAGKRSQKKSGKLAGGKLGALKMVTEAGVTFNIGSGFTDQQRVELWDARESLLGKIVKYKYFEDETDRKKFLEKGVKSAPRFPTFLGFRDPDDM